MLPGVSGIPWIGQKLAMDVVADQQRAAADAEARIGGQFLVANPGEPRAWTGTVAVSGPPSSDWFPLMNAQPQTAPMLATTLPRSSSGILLATALGSSGSAGRRDHSFTLEPSLGSRAVLVGRAAGVGSGKLGAVLEDQRPAPPPAPPAAPARPAPPRPLIQHAEGPPGYTIESGAIAENAGRWAEQVQYARGAWSASHLGAQLPVASSPSDVIVNEALWAVDRTSGEVTVKAGAKPSAAMKDFLANPAQYRLEPRAALRMVQWAGFLSACGSNADKFDAICAQRGGLALSQGGTDGVLARMQPISGDLGSRRVFPGDTILIKTRDGESPFGIYLGRGQYFAPGLAADAQSILSEARFTAELKKRTGRSAEAVVRPPYPGNVLVLR
jgi:hypothetical protein